MGCRAPQLVTGHVGGEAGIHATMTEFSCERCAEQLGEYADGVLGEESCRALEEHVARCADCARLVREYRAIPELVRRATDVAPPPDFRARLAKLLLIAGEKG